MRGTLDVMEAIARRAIAELANGTGPAPRGGPFLRARRRRSRRSRRCRPSTRRSALDRYEARLRGVPRVHGRLGRHRARGRRVRRDVAPPGDGARGGADRAPARPRPRGVPGRRAGGRRPRRGAADRGRRARRGEPGVRALPGDAAGVPAPLHGDDRPVHAPGRRRDLRRADPRVDHAAARPARGARAGAGALRGDPGGARGDRRPPRIRERRRRDRGASGERREHRGIA